VYVIVPPLPHVQYHPKNIQTTVPVFAQILTNVLMVENFFPIVLANAFPMPVLHPSYLMPIAIAYALLPIVTMVEYLIKQIVAVIAVDLLHALQILHEDLLAYANVL